VLQDVTPTRGAITTSTTSAPASARGTVAEHRRVVVRRLLARGLSPHALEQILPGWVALLQQGPHPVVDWGTSRR
jgi:hypothetical protein